jgi:hypothetical protein
MAVAITGSGMGERIGVLVKGAPSCKPFTPAVMIELATLAAYWAPETWAVSAHFHQRHLIVGDGWKGAIFDPEYPQAAAHWERTHRDGGYVEPTSGVSRSVGCDLLIHPAGDGSLAAADRRNLRDRRSGR